MSSELESTISFMDEKYSEEFIKSHRDPGKIRYGCLLFTKHKNIPLLRQYIKKSL